MLRDEALRDGPPAGEKEDGFPGLQLDLGRVGGTFGGGGRNCQQCSDKVLVLGRAMLEFLKQHVLRIGGGQGSSLRASKSGELGAQAHIPHATNIEFRRTLPTRRDTLARRSPPHPPPTS